MSPLPVLLALVALSMAVAACGSNDSTGTTGASSKQFAMAQCMRTHGAPSFPDPTTGSGGQGFSISATPGGTNVIVNGTSFSGPSFRAAEQACKLFGGASGPPPLGEHQRLLSLAFAKCMRSHGAPNFPDPNFGAGADSAKASSINIQSPAVQQAITTCRKR